MSNINDIVGFQAERRMFCICRKALEELEKFRDYSIALEKIMEQAGFFDKEYKRGMEIFKNARKILLDEANVNNREFQDLINKMEIKLK